MIQHWNKPTQDPSVERRLFLLLRSRTRVRKFLVVTGYFTNTPHRSNYFNKATAKYRVDVPGSSVYTYYQLLGWVYVDETSLNDSLYNLAEEPKRTVESRRASGRAYVRESSQDSFRSP